MIPGVSIPFTQPTNATLQGAFFYGSSSDVVAGRLPPQAVSATIAVPDAQNQSRGGGQGRGQPSPNTVQQGLSNPLAILNTSTPTSSASSAGNISSLFLAQLFGQITMQDSGSLGSYLGSFSPSETLDYQTMVAYSRVKYKPSNASLVPFERIMEAQHPPAPPSQAQVRELIARALQNQTAQQEPASTVQNASRMATNSSGFAAILTAAPQPKPVPKPASGNPPSLIRAPQGTSAYTATTSRNTLNLMQDTAPQIQLTL